MCGHRTKPVSSNQGEWPTSGCGGKGGKRRRPRTGEGSFPAGTSDKNQKSLSRIYHRGYQWDCATGGSPVRGGPSALLPLSQTVNVFLFVRDFIILIALQKALARIVRDHG